MAPSYRARSAKPARFTVVEDVNGNGFSLIEIDEVLLLLCGSFRWNTEGDAGRSEASGYVLHAFFAVEGRTPRRIDDDTPCNLRTPKL
jgi:hypothetical protein